MRLTSNDFHGISRSNHLQHRQPYEQQFSSLAVSESQVKPQWAEKGDGPYKPPFQSPGTGITGEDEGSTWGIFPIIGLFDCAVRSPGQEDTMRADIDALPMDEATGTAHRGPRGRLTGQLEYKDVSRS